MVPYRCPPEQKGIKDDKLLLAFDGLCLQTVIQEPIHVGKLVWGANKQIKKIRLQGAVKEAHAHLRQVVDLLHQEKEPPAILNRHGVACEFREQCRAKAVETDDLSLLTNMRLKERKKLHDKGIFTVTQLSYTFRPRRRRKNPHSMPEKFEDVDAYTKRHWSHGQSFSTAAPKGL